MGCLQQDFRTGKCLVFDPGIEQNGCDNAGNCICSDDEDPTYLCDDYQSDDQ